METRDSKKGVIKVRYLLLFLIIIIAIFAMAHSAAAKDVATNVITFTDKKVYLQWWIDHQRSKDFATSAQEFGWNTVEGSISGEVDQLIYVYAIVLDDEGNIMGGRTLRMNTSDTVLDHFDKQNWNSHHAIAANNTYFVRSNVNLNDSGNYGDRTANDKIYTTTIAMNASLTTDANTNAATTGRRDDQVRIIINVTDAP